MISGGPLEATAFPVENVPVAYVFYESGLSVNVMHTVDDPTERAAGSGCPRKWTSPAELASRSRSRRRSRRNDSRFQEPV